MGKWIWGIVVVLVIVCVVVIPGYIDDKRRSEYEAAVAARDLADVRWHAMTSAERCFDDAERALDTQDNAAALDPRTNPNITSTVIYAQPSVACYIDLASIIAMTGFPEAPYLEWVRSETALAAAQETIRSYYEERLWRDDKYASGPEKWAAFKDAKHRVHAALAGARAPVLSFVRQAMRNVQTLWTREHGKDAVWFAIELGFGLDDILQNPEPPAAPRVRAVIELADKAPADLRHQVRSDERIDRVLDAPKLDENLLRGLRQARDDLWTQSRTEWMPVPPQVPMYESCGGNAD